MNEPRHTPSVPDIAQWTEADRCFFRMQLGQILEDRMAALLRLAGLPHDYLSEVIQLGLRIDPATAGSMPTIPPDELRARIERVLRTVRDLEEPVRPITSPGIEQN